MKSFYDFYEEMMAAPTNSVGDGSKVALAPTHEPGIKKKKRYIYGGTGSRKMWMNNK